MAGSLSAALTFPLFAESEGWASHAASILECEIQNQTFPDGMNRELASDYHAFVLSCLLIAGGEADFAGAAFQRILANAVSHGRLVGRTGRCVRQCWARQGDSDSGRALFLMHQACRRSRERPGTCDLYSKPRHGGVIAARVASAHACWPGSCSLILSLCRIDLLSVRTAFPPPGLRSCAIFSQVPTSCGAAWIMGPMGFCPPPRMLMPMRCRSSCVKAGRRFLTDPGRPCYQDERGWRDYFRSTLAHNTLEVGGRDQALHAVRFSG